MRRRLVAAASLLLAACGPGHRYEVDAPGATEAWIAVCGRAPEAMPREAAVFALRRPADCRGQGEIVVRFEDGRSARCKIAFVAEALAAWYRFQATPGACRVG